MNEENNTLLESARQTASNDRPIIVVVFRNLTHCNLYHMMWAESLIFVFPIGIENTKIVFIKIM
jgi:hypothetical protein